MARKTSSKVSDDEDDTCRHENQNSVEHSTRPISPTSEEASKRAAVMSVDFDAILKHIGEMGPYQLVLYLMMCIPATLPAAFLAFNQECIIDWYQCITIAIFLSSCINEYSYNTTSFKLGEDPYQIGR